MTIDFDKYDKQIKVYGLNSIIKLNNSNVVIIGLAKGLATEILKNLTLFRVKNIFLLDDGLIEESDLLTGYYYNTNVIGKFRHDILKEKLCKLNENINIYNISFLDIENIDVLIVINKNKEEIVYYNNLCRNYNKKFISLQSSNNNGIVFIDAGLNHLVENINGKNYELIQIIDIDNTGQVTTNSHEFESGQNIFISNLNKIYNIEVINKYIFKLNDFNEPDFKFINGYAKYIDKSIYINHKSYEEQENIPNYIHNNYEIISVNSIMGSIVASEIIKLLTNKYEPFNQFFIWTDPDLDISLINNKLLNSEILVIGSGTLGCELLKNLAFLNVKKITISDPDIVRISNLSRQFLFDKSNINKFKSECAVNSIKNIKPNIEIDFMLEKVSSETENIFSEILNNKNLIVFNALNNSDSRFMINQCFNYNLPLFELNMINLSGNVHPIIPFVTDIYTNNLSNERSFPVCTIKNFPNEIIHTIYWALEQFEFFSKCSSQFNKNFIIWALNMFNEYFNNQINELLKAYPEDTLTTDNKLFWSAGKICPKPIEFNIDKHYNFIKETVNILSKCFDIEYNFNYEDIVNILKDYKYIPNDKNENISKFFPQEFNKNNNLHIKWINIVSNLRANNYWIETVDYYTTKFIACKIIPNVVATGSLVAGLATNEMIKYLSYNDITKFKSTSVNLVSNILINNEILPAKTIEIAGKKFNSWYKFIENDNLTIQEFINKYNKIFETNITMISLGSSLIYAEFMDNDKFIKLSDIIKEYSNNILTITSDDDNIDLPEIKIFLK